MIRDIAETGGGEVRGDVVVVGSGLAGVDLARVLARGGLRVVVAESGGRDYDAKLHALNEVAFAAKPHREQTPDSEYHGYLAEHLRGISRLRQFGGTSNVWTGKWRAFTERDLGVRPWLPGDGWPIGMEDLLPHYRACFADYGLGDVVEEAASPEAAALDAELAAAGLRTAAFYWEKTPTRSAVRFGEELERSERIDVILRATATELVLDDGLRRVRTVRCRSLDGHEVAVSAAFVILAAGGFETPRLLLASRRQVAAGVGNARDLVGRHYIDHPKHQKGRLRPGPRAAALARRLQFQPRPRFSLCFALDDAARGGEPVLNHSVYLRPVYERLWDRARRRLARRAPCRDELGAVDHYAVKVAFEQAPNRDSRVRLGAETDALGVPKLVVDWRFTDLDRRTIAEGCRRLRAAFARAGLGRLEFGVEPMTLDAMVDAAHHMGTTRMAGRPEDGVVDRDCKVFGTDNLFVAGSAVFPTGPVYSPTLTLLTLARRLGEHVLALHERAGGVGPATRARSA